MRLSLFLGLLWGGRFDSLLGRDRCAHQPRPYLWQAVRPLIAVPSLCGEITMAKAKITQSQLQLALSLAKHSATAHEARRKPFAAQPGGACW